jgi:hypothetical protein
MDASTDVDGRHALTRVGIVLSGALLLGAALFGAARLGTAQFIFPPGTRQLLWGVAALAALFLSRVTWHQGRAPRLPVSLLLALALTYGGVVGYLVPALEELKVVPDLARWTAAHAPAGARFGSYSLDRWSATWRFYLDRPNSFLYHEAEARAFLDAPGPFYCVMLRSEFLRFKEVGLPLAVAYEREGIFTTTGRSLMRGRRGRQSFVVVTRATP